MEKLMSYLKRIYGMDALSCGCLLLSLLFNLLTVAISQHIYSPAGRWNPVACIPLLVCGFRFFSTNQEKRRAENQWFVGIIDSLFTKKPENSYGNPQDQLSREDKKQFRFFKCPACRQKIRVPKGKGRIEITCPRCGDKFVKKT